MDKHELARLENQPVRINVSLEMTMYELMDLDIGIVRADGNGNAELAQKILDQARAGAREMLRLGTRFKEMTTALGEVGDED